jgi:hypothetical protein
VRGGGAQGGPGRCPTRPSPAERNPARRNALLAERRLRADPERFVLASGTEASSFSPPVKTGAATPGSPPKSPPKLEIKQPWL